MAELVLNQFGSEGSQLTRDTNPEREATFRKSSDLRLDTSKLESLGWTCKDSLTDMYKSMIDGWRLSAFDQRS